MDTIIDTKINGGVESPGKKKHTYMITRFMTNVAL